MRTDTRTLRRAGLLALVIAPLWWTVPVHASPRIALLESPRTPVRRAPGPPPRRVRPTPPPVVAAPTVDELAELYKLVGRELLAASQIDRSLTLDLWPRFRWIHFMESIQTPAKRAAAAELLNRILAELRAIKT